MDYDIGCFDEDDYKFVPLDNPLDKLFQVAQSFVICQCVYWFFNQFENSWARRKKNKDFPF